MCDYDISTSTLQALKFAYGWAWALTAVLIFIFPLPLLGEHYVFNESFFTFWVVIGFIWSISASFVTIVYPVWESREGKLIKSYHTSQRSHSDH